MYQGKASCLPKDFKANVICNTRRFGASESVCLEGMRWFQCAMVCDNTFPIANTNSAHVDGSKPADLAS